MSPKKLYTKNKTGIKLMMANPMACRTRFRGCTCNFCRRSGGDTGHGAPFGCWGCWGFNLNVSTGNFSITGTPFTAFFGFVIAVICIIWICRFLQIRAFVSNKYIRCIYRAWYRDLFKQTQVLIVDHGAVLMVCWNEWGYLERIKQPIYWSISIIVT